MAGLPGRARHPGRTPERRECDHRSRRHRHTDLLPAGSRAESVKNRLHLDINAGGPPGTPPAERRSRVDEAVQRLVASGATFVRASTQYGEYCVNMLDPEGNEFDVQ